MGIFRTTGLVLMLVYLSMTVVAQKGKQQTSPAQVAPTMDPARLEKAHEGLFSVQPNKAAEASRLTREVASVLTGTPSSAEIARKNFIDDQIFGRIERDRIPHAPLSGDEEFIRRAYLDATGLLPTSHQVLVFLADKDPQKRDKLIDSLVGSEEFVNQWAWFWGDLLRTKVPVLHTWTKQWLKADRPYNEVFYDIVTATTKYPAGIPVAEYYGAASYFALRDVTPTDSDNYYNLNRLDLIDAVSVDIGRVFLGINIECVSCHDGAGHADGLNIFLGRTTRGEFAKQAAFLGKMRRTQSWSDRQMNVGDQDSITDDLAPGYNTGNDAPFFTPAENRFPRDGKTYEPAFILTGEKPRPGENPRKALGRLLPNDPQFSRATVNLIWGKLMTVGFVEPYDGFDLDRLDPKNPPPKPWTIQPTNPELLNALAEDFRANNFSIHRLIKTIMKSNAYQLSARFDSEWKDDYIPYYARRFVRVLTGPEAVDAIAAATGRPYSFSQDGEEVTRVKQLSLPGGVNSTFAGPKEGTAVSTLMQVFFQSTRATTAPSGNKTSSVQAMMMMASPLVTRRVQADGTGVGRLLESGKSDAEIVEEMFLASLSRHPTSGELEVAKRLMENDRKIGAASLQWTLLNSVEFLLNH